MKKRSILSLSLFLAIFSFVSGVETSIAQDASDGTSQTEPAKLTGSVVKVEDIALTCDAIFVGEITDTGLPSDPSQDGWTAYTGIGVSVSEALRGSVDSQVNVTLHTLSNANVQESPPAYQHTYIFLVNKTSDATQDPYIVVKLLPATDDNIATVKKLLAQNSQ